MIVRSSKIEKWFCVWDANYGDFIDSFATVKDAREYCRKAIEGNPKVLHHYKIGKWISAATDEYKVIEDVKGGKV